MWIYHSRVKNTNKAAKKLCFHNKRKNTVLFILFNFRKIACHFLFPGKLHGHFFISRRTPWSPGLHMAHAPKALPLLPECPESA